MKKEHNIPNEIVLVDIEKLIPYVNNARTHSEEQIAQIAASIKEFGWTNPVLIDGDNGVIAGHGRVMAARKLGIDKVPCIELSHLSDTQKKAYIIADNKLSLNSGFNYDILKNELESLCSELDLSLLGFSQEELDSLIMPNFEPVTAMEQGKLDEKSKIKCPSCGHEFED